MSDIRALKKKLRERIHVSLRAQAGEANPEAPLQVRDLFLRHFIKLAPNWIVSGTSPIKGEMDPTPLMQALAHKGHPLCLPVIAKPGDALLFRAYRFGDALDKGVWGIGEPSAKAPLCTPHLLLCPLLAFDRKGRRLGYGGGYFDATLRNLRAVGSVMAVGLAFADQEVEDVPVDHTDQILDLIITEKEIIQPASDDR